MNVKPFRNVMVHCQVLHFNTMTFHVKKAKHLPYITTATNQSKEKENIPLTGSACNLVQQLSVTRTMNDSWTSHCSPVTCLFSDLMKDAEPCNASYLKG